MSLQATLPLVSLAVPQEPVQQEASPWGLRLRRAARQGGPVVLGTAQEPYNGEGSLASLLRYEGLEVAVTAQSPEILRDLDVLVELDRKCTVMVDMVLAAVDPFLSRRLEPRLEQKTADPKSRLQAVAQLAAEGIAVRILCTPLRPGLNNGEQALRPLFAAARQAGAWDVLPGATPARCSRFDRLRRALAGRRTPEPAGLDRRLAVFQRLRLEFGFPRLVAGRG
jgi:DNA repair photolyase